MPGDPLILARVQFGLNIAFHILFPTITIALGWFLLFLRLRASRGAVWAETAYRLWVKIFALSFALGVVSGVTMSFQFGTNWPGFMQKVGNIAGPLLGYEVLTAFFLEATFLGVMLFGRDRVPPWLHTLATLLVAVGTTASAFWILALNSWMQTPAGYSIVDGQFHARDWSAILFSPSFPYRFAHMLVASGLTVSFLVAGISAFQLLSNPAHGPARRMLRVGLLTAAVLAPIQIAIGDQHGLNTLAHQPAKIAAIEAVWHTERGAPLLLFALPDPVHERNDFALEIPRGASLILKHDPDAEIRGLDEFVDRHPPVRPVFFAFRIMVGVGVLMLGAAWLGTWLTRGNRLPPRFALRTLAALTFSGWIATLAGWIVTEVGRQPYLVYGLMTTAEAASDVPAGDIAVTLAAYASVYALLIVSYMVVLTQLARKEARSGPDATTGPSGPVDVHLRPREIL
ncbi:MAG: cytochrome ubiquinol oxidase subunit I [Betaproteobacteria bacterium]|nr:cytochrome ubiquinol oxidase subunit I [Betaproteobacteria bacterium]